MTSEKHAHNVAILHQQQQQQQHLQQKQQQLQQFAAVSQASHLIANSHSLTALPADVNTGASCVTLQSWPVPPVPLPVLGAHAPSSGEFLRQTFDLMQLAGTLLNSGSGGSHHHHHHQQQQPLAPAATAPTAGPSAAPLVDRVSCDSGVRRVSSSSSATYECEACPYRTNLRANFHLHCQTDKHLQRVGETLALIDRRRRESVEFTAEPAPVASSPRAEGSKCDDVVLSDREAAGRAFDRRAEGGPRQQRFTGVDGGRSSVEEAGASCDVVCGRGTGMSDNR
jgi:hypothetical protein